jgi:hypothetical protein
VRGVRHGAAAVSADCAESSGDEGHSAFEAVHLGTLGLGEEAASREAFRPRSEEAVVDTLALLGSGRVVLEHLGHHSVIGTIEADDEVGEEEGVVIHSDN